VPRQEHTALPCCHSEGTVSLHIKQPRDLSSAHHSVLQHASYHLSHTHTHTQLFYSSMDLVRDNPGEPVPEEIFTYTQLSWSSIAPYLLDPSNMIHGTPPLCSIQMPDNLSPSFLWSTSWPGTPDFILHTFLHPVILFFSQHMPIPSQPVLILCHLTLVSLSNLYLEFYLVASHHTSI